jgi:hypothetical protein
LYFIRIACFKVTIMPKLRNISLLKREDFSFEDSNLPLKLAGSFAAAAALITLPAIAIAYSDGVPYLSPALRWAVGMAEVCVGSWFLHRSMKKTLDDVLSDMNEASAFPLRKKDLSGTFPMMLFYMVTGMGLNDSIFSAMREYLQNSYGKLGMPPLFEIAMTAYFGWFAYKGAGGMLKKNRWPPPARPNQATRPSESADKDLNP